MPSYLVHGFRWSRPLIRIHIASYDLEDAAAEWIVLPSSAITLLNSFYTICDFLPPSQPPRVVSSPGIDLNSSLPNSPTTPSGARMSRIELSKPGGAVGKPPPHLMDPKTFASANAKAKQKFNDWSVVKLLEQYDPEDETTASQPYAYVADYIHEVKLSLDVAEEMRAYEERQTEMKVMVETATASKTPTSPNPNGNGNGPVSPLSAIASANGLDDPQGHNRTMSGRDLRRLSRQVGWIEKLRDKLEQRAEIAWYIVRCDDADRIAPPEIEAVLEGQEEDEEWDDEEQGEDVPDRRDRRKLSKERDNQNQIVGTLRGLLGRNKEKARGRA